MSLWIKHPRSGEKDTMLTIAVLAFLSAVVKFLTNGVTLELGEKSLSFGTIDAALIGALLTPTLGAYILRKHKDSPDKKEEKK